MPWDSKLQEFVDVVLQQRNLVVTNDYFRAGVGLLIFGQGATLMHKGLNNLVKYLRKKLFITVEINSKDECYQWLVEWLAEQPSIKKATEVVVETQYNTQISNNPSANRPLIMYTPSFGSHWITYKRQYFWMERIRDTTASDLTTRGFLETFRITTLARNRKAVTAMIEEACDLTLSKDHGKTIIYTNSHGDWRKFGPSRKQRSLSSVILEKGIIETIVHDIQTFLNDSEWYIEKGIPYRRGYLFYGNPGSGKTSLIFALAGYFGMNICQVNLSDKEVNDEILNLLLNSTPPQSIVLMEDIDVAFTDRSRDGSSHVTFSGLLNALDGVAAQEGRLIFLTTNKKEVLDEALIRPGRVDLNCFFGLAAHFQIQLMYQRFFPEAPVQHAQSFAEKIPDKSVSMATVQNYLMKYRMSPEKALHNTHELLNTPPN